MSSTVTSHCIPTPYYTPEEFDELYGGEAYNTVMKILRSRLDDLLDLYAKAVQRR